MGIVHPAVGIATGQAYRGQADGLAQPYTRRQADELARLGAEVARLEAERAALSWAAGHDELTGLPNRRLLAALAVPRVHATDTPVAVLVLDLNGFKPINDGYGHQAGDLVLREIALRIAGWAGANPAGRIGGDEFAAVLTGPAGAGSAPAGANHAPTAAGHGLTGAVHGSGPARTGRHWWEPGIAALCAAVARPITVAGVTVTLGAAVGVATGDGTAGFPDLLNRADMAMYRAKAAGQPYAVWSPVQDGAGGGTIAGGHDRAAGTECSIELALFPAPSSPAPSSPADHRQPAAARPARPAPRAHPPRSRPEERPEAEVAPANSYRSGDPVWVHRYGAWRPGVVDAASARAVMTTYRYTDGMATVVDTVPAEYVVLRASTETPAPRSHPAEVAA